MRADDIPSDHKSWVKWVNTEIRRLRNRPAGSGGGGGGVTSVNGDPGPAVVLTAADVGADLAGAASDVQDNLDDHIADTVGAHAASAISNAPSGTVSGTTVQAAINELDSEKIPKALVDAKGDLLVGTADDVVARQAVGSNGQVLTADSSVTNGLKWAASALSWIQDINDALSSAAGFLTALSGTWAINAGVLRQSSAATPARISYSQQIAAGSARAVEVECAHISSAGAIRRFGLIVYSNNTVQNSLIVYLDSGNGTNWTLKADVDGVTALSTSAALAYTGTGYVRISAMCHGSVADIYLNGTFMMTVNAQTMTGANLARVGLYTYSCTADFRNLKVWHPYGVPF